MHTRRLGQQNKRDAEEILGIPFSISTNNSSLGLLQLHSIGHYITRRGIEPT